MRQTVHFGNLASPRQVLVGLFDGADGWVRRAMLILGLSKREVMYLASGRVAIGSRHFGVIVGYAVVRRGQMVDPQTGEVRPADKPYWSAFCLAARAVNELYRRRCMTLP